MDERLWTDRPLGLGAQLDLAGCVVTREDPGALYLVSGDLSVALQRLSAGADMLGFGEAPKGEDYALRIGRDHALLRCVEPIDARPDQKAEGFVVSEAGSLYACLHLGGPNAWDVLAQGLASAPPMGSASCAIPFCGVRALVSGAPDGLYLWVEAAYLTYVTSFLRQSAAAGRMP